MRVYYDLQEELQVLSQAGTRVQVFVNEQYSCIGLVKEVHQNFVIMQEEKATNDVVILPMNKMLYVRKILK